MHINVPYKPNQQSFVLIVEPAAESRIRIAKALQRSGMRVIAVGSGFDALDVAQGLGGPALAIVELSLPDMSGLELTTRLHKSRPCPVIIITSEANPKLAAELLNLVAEDVVSKPFDEREIAARAYRVMMREVKRMAPQRESGPAKSLNGHYFRNDIRTIN
ncbi:MAG: response regulator [Caldilineaceae bacterium]